MSIMAKTMLSPIVALKKYQEAVKGRTEIGITNSRAVHLAEELSIF
jgi:hypothetical protein